MIKEVQVWNYKRLEQFLMAPVGFDIPPDRVFISVRDPHKPNRIFLNESDKALPLYFWDVDPENNLSLFVDGRSVAYIVEQEEAFTESQAEDVIRVIDKWHGYPDDYVLISQCEAGISRSGAIAVFASEHCGLPYERLIDAHPWIRPNAYVLSMLRRKERGITR